MWVRRYAIDALLVNKFHCAEEYTFTMPFPSLSISKGELRWWWLLILIMLMVHGHGRGKRLSTCLVVKLCAFA